MTKKNVKETLITYKIRKGINAGKPPTFRLDHIGAVSLF